MGDPLRTLGAVGFPYCTDIPNTSLWLWRGCLVNVGTDQQTIQWPRVPLLTRGTLQIRIWFVRQRSSPTLEQTNHTIQVLKYGFCKKSLRKNETLTSWTLLAHFFSRSVLIWKKSESKVFNWSEFHFSEVTSYKIHTLIYDDFTILYVYCTMCVYFEHHSIADKNAN